MKTILTAAAAIVLATAAIAASGVSTETMPEMSDALDVTMTSLEGQSVDLNRYRGKVVLMVNVASECGYTPQYAGLQKLHERYEERGLAILGFPSNDFGGQEPGSDSQIRDFCERNYGVEFDMFSKIVVQGPRKAPLYDYLTSSKTNPGSPGEVKWNFEKFLIDRDGSIAGRFPSAVEPDSREMVSAIEAALAP